MIIPGESLNYTIFWNTVLGVGLRFLVGGYTLDLNTYDPCHSVKGRIIVSKSRSPREKVTPLL